ncbi:class I SAM-dependent methyltransferase [Gilvimarinus sp. F26214L]|uniref:class I SAM-dependent methyltransferase n=1 Tax=Gilvimarinus sp. DZF01 TaxID=3461371 RepID=UPI0040467457
MSIYENPQVAPKQKNKPMTAVKARSRAQQLAFAPVIFYAAVVMRNTGLLKSLEEANGHGATRAQLGEQCGLSEYAVSVLLELAADAEIVSRDDDRFVLDDLGYFLLNDTMTQVNMDFVRDICFQALPFLEQSLVEGRPAGLHTLGEWSNVYEGLSKLSEPARSSWFRFDHYYSDAVFDSLLDTVFARGVTRLMDIGANTGRWALKCLHHDPDVQVTMVDLPGQLEIAERHLAEQGLRDRATLCPMDVLNQDAQFPGGAEAIWMSQFLDCFSPENIVSILERVARQMDHNTRAYILEPFSDKQQFPAGSLSLNATSLYFTCVANGSSRMYRYDEFRPLVEQSGLIIESEQHLNFGHSLLVCRLG